MRKTMGLMVLMLLLTGCKQDEQMAAEKPLRTVKALQVLSSAQQSESLRLAGEIKPRVEVDLAFRVAGKVVQRVVDLGDQVSAGQTLARLETTDYELALRAQQAEVVQRKAQLRLAESDLQRFTDLLKKNFINEADVARQKTAVDSARAALQAAEAQLKQREREVSYTILQAESAGVITAINVNAGQVVAVGQPVFKVAHSNTLEVEVSVPEASLIEFRNAKSFEISVNALSAQRLTGTLRELAAAAESGSRSYKARIRLEKSDASLALNMSTTVRPVLAQHNAVNLPLAAVFSRDGKHYVWRIEGESHTLNAIVVETGVIQGDQWQVLSGIASGDVIVSAGATLLHQGEAVRPQL